MCADVPLTHDRRLADIFLSYVPFHPLANPPLPSYQPLAKPIKLPKPHKVSITSLLSLHAILPVSYPLTHFTPQPPLCLGQITSPAPRVYHSRTKRSTSIVLTYHTKLITSSSNCSYEYECRHCRPQRFNSVEEYLHGRAESKHSR